jgi:PiT family inorganic phosphate transporter
MFLVFLTSGLFLGWSLGANDAANIFGTAVGTRMLRFRTAAIIAGVFVIIGAVVQGGGGSETLGNLVRVITLSGSFSISLAAALTVFLMTRWAIPVSTSQAVVGAIIGWNLYSGQPTDFRLLVDIALSWVLSPVLGAIFAVLLYLLLKAFIRLSKIHLLKLDSWIRYLLIVAAAFGAYSLGANNIGNVVGVYIGAANLADLHIAGLFTINGAQQLLLVGGLAIAAGILTYSKKTIQTIGKNLLKLSAESAIVIVLAQSMVLFVFSSTTLQQFLQGLGLPAIPLVPVSSSHAVIGAIIGIGLLKGGAGIRYRILGHVAVGWVATPVIAALFAYILLVLLLQMIGMQA